MLEPSITPTAASDVIWDAIVIGAGPAGAFSALQLARAGQRVLLLEAKRFPRQKVCGGCVNAKAVAILQQVGLQHVAVEAPARPISGYRFFSPRAGLTLRVQGGVAISRAVFDMRLAHEAIRAGASYLDETLGTLLPSRESQEPYRQVRLRTVSRPAAEAVIARGRVVLVADGLSRSSLTSTSEFSSQIATHSWLGIQGLVPGSAALPAGHVQMAMTRHGYVGAVALGESEINLAAAVSRRALQRFRSPPELVSEILLAAGLSPPDSMHHGKWIGTGPLTRTSLPVAGYRTFLLGDAAGYVEPFTGEGMGHALAGAHAVAQLLTAGRGDWDDAMRQAWATWYRTEIGRRQWLCRSLVRGLRSPLLSAAGLRLASFAPPLTKQLVSLLNLPHKGVLLSPLHR
jgi:flavin-dependent dehydrogenase